MDKGPVLLLDSGIVGIPCRLRFNEFSPGESLVYPANSVEPKVHSGPLIVIFAARNGAKTCRCNRLPADRFHFPCGSREGAERPGFGISLPAEA
jgi:hypothetical protein